MTESLHSSLIVDRKPTVSGAVGDFCQTGCKNSSNSVTDQGVFTPFACIVCENECVFCLFFFPHYICIFLFEVWVCDCESPAGACTSEKANYETWETSREALESLSPSRHNLNQNERKPLSPVCRSLKVHNRKNNHFCQLWSWWNFMFFFWYNFRFYVVTAVLRFRHNKNTCFCLKYPVLSPQMWQENALKSRLKYLVLLQLTELLTEGNRGPWLDSCHAGVVTPPTYPPPPDVSASIHGDLFIKCGTYKINVSIVYTNTMPTFCSGDWAGKYKCFCTVFNAL